MRRYKDLTEDDKKNKNDLQARIDKALAEADRMQTPWFAGEYIMDDEFVKQELLSMARADAEDAWYPDKTEAVIRL